MDEVSLYNRALTRGRDPGHLQRRQRGEVPDASSAAVLASARGPGQLVGW